MFFRVLLMLLFIFIAVFAALSFFISMDYIGFAYAGLALLFVFDLYNYRDRLSTTRKLFTLALIVFFTILSYNAFN